MIRPLARKCLDLLKSARSRLVNPCDPPVVVLIYHRVTTLAHDPQQLAVTPEHFRAQMRYLGDHFPVLRFEEDWRGVREPSVCVSFDDGYADNFLEALPILEQERIPASFFVSTGGLGTRREFWWDELERLLLEPGERPETCSVELGALSGVWATGSRDQRRRCYDELHPLWRPLAPERLEHGLDQLRRWAGCGPQGRESHRPLSVAELRALAASPWVTLGAHCVRHPRLSALPAERQREEILQSKLRLEELSGGEVRVFSYPFGCRGDYDRTSVRICRELGFRRVAANFPGQVHSWCDPMQAPRQLVRDWPLERFARKLEGFFRV
jgi:peptidoglycan/xylan/chitin deacetylase (PgdA/CDA1 family)